MIGWHNIKQTLDPGPWSSNSEPGAPGQDGKDGRNGFDGKDGRDGQSLRPVGQWTRIRNYQTGDVVEHNGSSFIAIEPSKGRMPSVAKSVWMLNAKAIKGERGKQGPAGPRGRRASETTDVVFTAPKLAAGQVVYLDGGSPALAKADNPSTAEVLGFSVGNGSVRTSGKIKVNAVLTPGGRVWLSPTVAGGVTQTAPSNSGEVVVPLGLALSLNQIDVDIDTLVVL